MTFPGEEGKRRESDMSSVYFADHQAGPRPLRVPQGRRAAAFLGPYWSRKLPSQDVPLIVVFVTGTSVLRDHFSGQKWKRRNSAAKPLASMLEAITRGQMTFQHGRWQVVDVNKGLSPRKRSTIQDIKRWAAAVQLEKSLSDDAMEEAIRNGTPGIAAALGEFSRLAATHTLTVSVLQAKSDGYDHLAGFDIMKRLRGAQKRSDEATARDTGTGRNWTAAEVQVIARYVRSGCVSPLADLKGC